MLTLSRFNEVTKGLPDNFLIKMSCSSLEYTKEHPECADSGWIYSEGYGTVCFDIDWNSKPNISMTLGDFRDLIKCEKLDDDVEIMSVDVDDGNWITFEDIILVDNLIILV